MKISEIQKELLLDYLESNTALTTGKTSPNFTQKDIQKKWQVLAGELNALEGPEKDWKNWRKTWHDMHNRTKMKCAANNRVRGQTGGGPSEEQTLTTVEKRIYENFIKKVSVQGEAVVKESQSVFTFTIPPEPSNVPVVLPLHEPIENPASPEDDSLSLPARSPSPKLTGKRKAPAEAREEYANYLEKKLEIKKKYYDKKLELLEKQVELMEHDVQFKYQMLELKKKKYGVS